MQNSIIRKSNYLVEAIYKLSTVEQKLIAVLASTINDGDEDFKECPLIIRDFQKLLGNTPDNYVRLEDITENLIAKVNVIREPEGKVQFAWLSSARYIDKEGTVYLRFDPLLRPYLLQLKERFTKYRLKNVVQLKSWFSIRLYELLKQYEKLKERAFEYSELRLLLKIGPEQYQQTCDFIKKIIVVAQEEIAKKTDIAFTFEEIRRGHRLEKLRFFIKSQIIEITRIAPPPLAIEAPQDHDLEKLIALLSQKYRSHQSVQKLLKIWLAKKGVDYVARNIEFANDGSNAVNPGASLGKGSNYRNYLAKALAGDFGLPYKEDMETKKKAEEDARRKAQEETAAEKHRQEQAQNQKENHERAQIFQKNLPPEALEQLEAEAFSSLDPQQQELVKKNVPGSKMTLKMRMDKISLERMKIT